MGPDVCPSVTERPFVDLTDVTLADEDTNSIPTDNANRAFQGKVSIQVTQSDGQLWTPRPCVDLTDVTLADEDTNSILTDNAKRAIQGNVTMQ